jgi:hypothetical protein
MSELTQILEQNEIKESTPKKRTIKSVRVLVEKLDNGFISDAEGKRRIYNDTTEIIQAVGMNSILDKIDQNEYRLNIDLIPKEEYEDYVDAVAFGEKMKEEETLSLQKAKEQGIIECEKFSPFKIKHEVEPDTEIKITAANCYTVARLRAINFSELDAQLPLTNTEKAKICGISIGTMYGLWKKVISGNSKYQLSSTRIAMTILAKYYEKNLNIRTSTKDQHEQLKSSLLESIREIELMTDGNKFIKSSELSKKINEMRKLLMK